MWSGEYFGFGEVEILELVESEIAMWEGGRFLIFLSFGGGGLISPLPHL
jgi:hypothetical protein